MKMRGDGKKGGVGGSKRRASSKVGRFLNNAIVGAYVCDKCFS